MVEVQHSQNAAPKDDNFLLVRMGAYSVAALAGINAGITKVWDVFYDNFKKHPAFKTLREDRQTALEVLGKKAEITPSLTRQDIAKQYRKIENDYGHEFNKKLKKQFRIESEGFWGRIKGTAHRFEALGNVTQAKIASVTAFTTAAAVVGLVLTEVLVNNHNAKKLYDDVQAQANKAEPART